MDPGQTSSVDPKGQDSTALPTWITLAPALVWQHVTEISGTVADALGNALPQSISVTVTVTWNNGANSASTTAAADGTYEIYGNFGTGSVTVTARYDDWVFSSNNPTLTPGGGDVGNVNFQTDDWPF